MEPAAIQAALISAERVGYNKGVEDMTRQFHTGDPKDRPLRPIPIGAAKAIADLYGYDQVVVIGRRVGEAEEPHGEHVTTYGRDASNCSVAARMGNFFKHKLMGWPEPEPDIQTPKE